MSASTPTPPGTPSTQAGGAADPSMEDILASIRRILSDDEAEAANPSTANAPSANIASPNTKPSDVLELDSSMIVSEPASSPPGETPSDAPSPSPPPAFTPQSDGLVAPAAAAAAASSVGNLVRTLIAEREQVAIHRGGPTIEDVVREEIRPLLKQWLDTHLPQLVERLVRQEIERVVGRSTS